MDPSDTDIGLFVWAVTCDALARGEQIFVLLPGAGTEVSALRQEGFWLLPDWEGTDPRSLTEPYQDRLRALESLRHHDHRIRVKYFATAEYAEAIESPRHLRALDGDHTLDAEAVDRLFRAYGGYPGSGDEPRPGVSLVVLRVHARDDAVIRESAPRIAEPRDGGECPEPGLPRPLRERWVRLPEPVSHRSVDPVVGGERFLSRKARLLQRTGAVRAV